MIENMFSTMQQTWKTNNSSYSHHTGILLEVEGKFNKTQSLFLKLKIY